MIDPVVEIDIKGVRGQTAAVLQRFRQLRDVNLARSRAALFEAGHRGRDEMQTTWQIDPENPKEKPTDYGMIVDPENGPFAGYLYLMYVDWIGGLSMDDILYDHEVPTVKRGREVAADYLTKRLRELWR